MLTMAEASQYLVFNKQEEVCICKKLQQIISELNIVKLNLILLKRAQKSVPKMLDDSFTDLVEAIRQIRNIQSLIKCNRCNS